ncbi:MAG TPA: hypothetical protein VMF30_10340 [Pirellulales bacterium]|nr:hypothetical protein [Pirellulales bacterium]
MSLLVQFIFRVVFGMAAAMALVPPRQVTSGYFRNNLYVLLGLDVLATLVALAERSQFPLWPPLAGAIACYLGGALWLYEKPAAGRNALVLIAALALVGAWLAPRPLGETDLAQALFDADLVTGGLLLGTTMAAMLLGHWYLNSPTMALAPLRRLIGIMGLAIAARAVPCGIGLALVLSSATWPSQAELLFLLLRWLSGLLGAAGLAVMAWKTLLIPNTQSSTGILYVAVIATFIGELVSLLLSGSAAYPL